MMFYDAGTDCFQMDAWEKMEQQQAILKTLRETDVWGKLHELNVKSIEFTGLHKMVLTIDAGAGFTYQVDIAGWNL